MNIHHSLCGIMLGWLLLGSGVNALAQKQSPKINRFALVNRHNISVTRPDTLGSLSVGNGNFAFTTDITGLQTFYREYERGVTLGTQSNWGWHTFPNINHYSLDECTRYHDYRGRKVPYLVQFDGKGRNAMAVNYFRENPQRLQLGIIMLILLRKDGTEARLKDIQNPVHSLNLWEGRIKSVFYIEGQKVTVDVFCHQKLDMISARINSPLIHSGQLKVEWIFPYAVAQNTHSGYDFDSDEKHQSKLVKSGTHKARIFRTLDNDHYQVAIQWDENASVDSAGRHHFVLTPKGENSFSFSCLFSRDTLTGVIPTFAQTEANNLQTWKNFWMKSGVVDFSACKDSRAFELERRFVLSQYLTKIQSSGSLPPQETGLVYNSWYGKFHLEMIWWHTSHFANWNHPEYIENQLDWYLNIFHKARETAHLQGFKGVRWPKMVGPEGQNSPSGVGSYLIWQQPHVIYLAEQLYQSKQNPEILRKYKELVFSTAEFMADFAVPDSSGKVYNLLPPLIPAQEHWDRETTVNPPFELAYWHWGLTAAQLWLKRLDLPANPIWEKVRNGLPAPAQANNLYLGTANATDSYTNPDDMKDHPMVLGSFGMLPEWEKIDKEVMRNTLKEVMKKWDWTSTWGWDYPMVAMCAARIGEPEIALEAFLKDVQKNTWLVNGHNYQSSRLRIYLPGNGGFLKAITLMCAGWQGCKTINPGFPHDGKWNIRWENLEADF